MDRRSFIATAAALLASAGLVKAATPSADAKWTYVGTIQPKVAAPEFQVYTIEQLAQYGSIYPSSDYWDSVFEAAKVARQYCDSRKLEMHVLQVLPHRQAAPIDIRLLVLCDKYTIQTDYETYVWKDIEWTITST